MIVFSCPILGNCERVKPSIAVITDYSRADDNAISAYLSACLLQVSLLHDVSELWLGLKQIVYFFEESYIPYRKKRVNSEHPCTSREITHLKRKVKRMRREKNPRVTYKILYACYKRRSKRPRNIFFTILLTCLLR